MDAIHHLTSTTGHCRVSPRSEVDQLAIDYCKPLVVDGIHPVPGFRGYFVRSATVGSMYEFVIRRETSPMIRGRLTGDTLTIDILDKCAIWSAADWLGDFERCLAWAWIESQGL